VSPTGCKFAARLTEADDQDFGIRFPPFGPEQTSATRQKTDPKKHHHREA